MKRLLLYVTTTAMLMLVSNGVFGAKAALAPLSAIDIANTTAGICLTCGSSSNPKPPSEPNPSHVISSVWRIINQNDTPLRQVSYSITGEWVNSGPYTQTITEHRNDRCRNVLTSGGIGISTGLNLTVGTTYHCDITRAYTFTLPAFSRTKLYQAEMRYFTNYEAALVDIWSDGRETVTSVRDYGVQRHDYTRYNPVSSPY